MVPPGTMRWPWTHRSRQPAAWTHVDLYNANLERVKYMLMQLEHGFGERLQQEWSRWYGHREEEREGWLQRLNWMLDKTTLPDLPDPRVFASLRWFRKGGRPPAPKKDRSCCPQRPKDRGSPSSSGGASSSPAPAPAPAQLPEGWAPAPSGRGKDPAPAPAPQQLFGGYVQPSAPTPAPRTAPPNPFALLTVDSVVFEGQTFMVVRDKTVHNFAMVKLPEEEEPHTIRSLAIVKRAKFLKQLVGSKVPVDEKTDIRRKLKEEYNVHVIREPKDDENDYGLFYQGPYPPPDGGPEAKRPRTGTAYLIHLSV